MKERFSNEDWAEFKEYCKSKMEAEFDEVKAIISQTVTNTPEGISDDEFKETLSYLDCYIRECNYCLLMDFIKDPEYREVKGGPILTLIDRNAKPGPFSPRKMGASPVGSDISYMVHNLFPEEYGKAILMELNKFMICDNPVCQLDEKLLLDRLVKTNDTDLYKFSIEEHRPVIRKDIICIQQRNDKIRKSILSSFHPSAKVLEALTKIVEETVSVAATLWGDDNKINPDVADCHGPFKSTKRVENFNTPESEQPGTTYTTQAMVAIERTFMYMNVSSEVFHSDLVVETDGKKLLVYKSGMEVVEYSRDIYEDIKAPILEKCKEMLEDSNFSQLVNRLVNDIAPGHDLDVMFFPGFGVEICSGKRFPIHHTNC